MGDFPELASDVAQRESEARTLQEGLKKRFMWLAAVGIEREKYPARLKEIDKHLKEIEDIVTPDTTGL
jgi:hypothetical protein